MFVCRAWYLLDPAILEGLPMCLCAGLGTCWILPFLRVCLCVCVQGLVFAGSCHS